MFAVYRQKIKPPQASVIKVVIEVVYKEVGISLASKHFTYTPNSKVLYCKAPSVVKTEILHKKDAIIQSLQNELGERNAPTTII